jgi:hypothetical protein
VKALASRQKASARAASKAAEWVRLAAVKSPGGWGQGEVCVAACCLELACKKYGEAYDHARSVRMSCVDEKQYKSTLVGLESVLGIAYVPACIAGGLRHPHTDSAPVSAECCAVLRMQYAIDRVRGVQSIGCSCAAVTRTDPVRYVLHTIHRITAGMASVERALQQIRLQRRCSAADSPHQTRSGGPPQTDRLRGRC